jgi:anaerobic magnesium-protoporphyrin IX monomethyl ester cyclase
MKVFLAGVNQLSDHGQYFADWEEEFQSSPFEARYHSLPIGLLYIASAQRKFGRTACEYELFDFNMLGETDNEVLFAEYQRRLAAFDPDVVAFGGLSHRQIAHMERAIGLARDWSASRGREIHMIAGGMPATAQPARFLGMGVDAVCIGEGEMTFTEFIDCVAEGEDLGSVSGLALWRGATAISPDTGPDLFESASIAATGGDEDTVAGIRRTPVRPQVQDLDDLPMPAWDLAPVRELVKLSKGVYSPMLTQRGCPYECFYCDHDRRFRSHSARRVVDEIEFLAREYGARRVDIVDEIFNCSKKRILEIRDEKKRRGIHTRIQDYDGLRADILDEETVDALAEAGLVACSVAVEVGTDRMQKLIRKKLKLERAMQATQWLVDRKIFVNAFFMIGFPTEERHEIEQTLKLAADCPAHMCTLSKVEVYPGTAMWDFAIENGVDPSHSYGDSTRFGARKDAGVTTISEDELHALWRRGLWDIYNQPARLNRVIGLFGIGYMRETYERFYRQTGIWSPDFQRFFEGCYESGEFERILEGAQARFFTLNPELETLLAAA